MHTRATACLPWAIALLAFGESRARAFDYFEHRWIGDVACGLFAAEAGERAPCVLWRDAPGGVGTVTFGDLTALVGDHYGTPEELAEVLVVLGRHAHEDAPACRAPGDAGLAKLCAVLAYRELELAFVRAWFASRRRAASDDLEACAALTPWLGIVDIVDPFAARQDARPSAFEDARMDARRARADAGASRCREELERAAAALDEAVPDRCAGDCFAPPSHLVARLRGLPDRVALAAADGSHFGAQALEGWRAHQRRARAARSRGDEVLALAEEAFALHFLSDLFAAGHIRNPRDSMGHGYGDVMRYHDQDNATGLLVEAPASPTRRWFAYGDRCLFGAAAGDNRAMVVEASRAAIAGLRRADAAAWAFVLVLGLYSGVGALAGGGRRADGRSGLAATPGVELVVAHDWQLTTWWNPLLDFRHGVSWWGDGTVVIELASAPLMEVATLPALPFVALSSATSAEALRRFGKGIDPPPHVHLGPLMMQLDADVGIALVRVRGSAAFATRALVRTGVSLEVPDRWRVFVPRVTILGNFGDAPWLVSLTAGIEHAF